MNLNHKYKARLVKSSTTVGGNSSGSKIIILKLCRPVMFDFKPGQYAFLRLPAIDGHWHPFSIASGPGSSNLEFYIEVFEKDSWTEKLWQVLRANEHLGTTNVGCSPIVFEVMGPYGCSMGSTKECSHAIAIGAGTGRSGRCHYREMVYD